MMLIPLFFTTFLPSALCMCQDGAYKRGGNPFIEYSEKATTQGFEYEKLTEPVIDVIPLVQTEMPLNQIGQYLSANGYVAQNIADNIQARLGFSSSVKSVFHDFSSANSTFNFYSLPSNLQTIDNFFNLHLQRSSVLFSAQKNEDSVSVQIKKVVVSIRKRRSYLGSQRYSFPRYCQDYVNDCGYKPVSTTKCELVPYMIGTFNTYTTQCRQVTEQQYSCNMITKTYTEIGVQELYKFELNSNFNQGEVDQIYQILNDAAAAHMALQ